MAEWDPTLEFRPKLNACVHSTVSFLLLCYLAQIFMSEMSGFQIKQFCITNSDRKLNERPITSKPKCLPLKQQHPRSVLINIILSLYCVQMLLNCPCPEKWRLLDRANEFKPKLLSRRNVVKISVLFQQRSPDKCHMITWSSFQWSLAVDVCLH